MPSFDFKTNGRILKANSSWSPTWVKFCQLIASLSVVPPQLNLTKLKLEYLKFGFQCKKERHKQIFLRHLSSTFFRVYLKFAFRIRRKSWHIPVNLGCKTKSVTLQRDSGT